MESVETLSSPNVIFTTTDMDGKREKVENTKLHSLDSFIVNTDKSPRLFRVNKHTNGVPGCQPLASISMSLEQ